MVSVCRNGNLSNGCKSRSRNSIFTWVVPKSGGWVTIGRKFFMDKTVGRNESEPICSFVN